MDKIFINANAGTPYPKNFKAAAVISTSFKRKRSISNNAFTISLDAKINPKLAGIENRVKVQKIYFVFQKLFNIFHFKSFERTGKETVPTATPAMARLI